MQLLIPFIKTGGDYLNNDSSPQNVSPPPFMSINSDLNILKQDLSNAFFSTTDLRIREINLLNSNKKMLICYLKNLVDKELLYDYLLKPLTEIGSRITPVDVTIASLHNILPGYELLETNNLNNAVNYILLGNALIFMQGEANALASELYAQKGRSIEQPETEITFRGSKEGFVESLNTNIFLLRKLIHSRNLVFEVVKVGKQSDTEICICYMNNIVNDEILKKVKNKINSISYGSMVNSGVLESFLSEKKYSLFPTVGNSEKPDKVASKILEGRVAIIINGSPVVLTVPYLFIEAIQTSDDYTENFFYYTIIRFLRLLALFISMFLPALFVAILSFNQSIIPFNLLITISSSREGIPFPPFLECLLMLLTFEILKEAGIRMPRAVGQTISIVGAIVLGDAAVGAGITSPIMVIIIAITAITSFIVPPFMKSVAILRILLIISANTLGLYGIALVGVIVFIYLCNLQSYNVPYLAPIAPIIQQDIKDSYIVYPMWAMVTRPVVFSPNNVYRAGNSKKNNEADKNG